MQIFTDNLSDMDCVMVQPMLEARQGKKKGATVKSAASDVKQRRRKMQGLQDEEETQQQQIDGLLEKTNLREDKKKQGAGVSNAVHERGRSK